MPRVSPGARVSSRGLTASKAGGRFMKSFFGRWKLTPRPEALIRGATRGHRPRPPPRLAVGRGGGVGAGGRSEDPATRPGPLLAPREGHADRAAGPRHQVRAGGG